MQRAHAIAMKEYKASFCLVHVRGNVRSLCLCFQASSDYCPMISISTSKHSPRISKLLEQKLNLKLRAIQPKSFFCNQKCVDMLTCRVQLKEILFLVHFVKIDISKVHDFFYLIFSAFIFKRRERKKKKIGWNLILFCVDNDKRSFE